MPESDSKALTVLFYSLIALLFGVVIWFFWPREPPSPHPVPTPSASVEAPDPPKGPEKAVHDVFRSLGEGKIDAAKVAYDSGREPMKGVRVAVDPHRNTHTFHGLVKFPLTEVKVSAYDPKTESVAYSVRVPHPCVMFWQWDAVYPGELTSVPRGILMEGSYKLKRTSGGAWQVAVHGDENPVALYHKVSVSVNQLWYMAISQGGYSESMNLSMLMLFAAYTVALGVPKDQVSVYAKRWMKECAAILPKENAR